MVNFMTTALEQIEAFLIRHEMAATAFGELARNDRHLVRQLRDGRRLWPETETALLTFMSEYDGNATPDRVVMCATCERRCDDPAVNACTAIDCAINQREAA